ncbi:MAG: hypothetical protein HQL54_04930 [Magnetococcales bacterium]|nr:hypothetical protein [Magnetococcales bacterium]
MFRKIILMAAGVGVLFGGMNTVQARQSGPDTCELGTTLASCWIAVKDVRPTQFTVGGTAVNCKRKKFNKKSQQKMDDYLAKDGHELPTIIGPAGNYYITDHHHLSSALYYAEGKDDGWIGKDQQVRLVIKQSYYKANPDERISMQQFWTEMVNDGRAWPYNGDKRVPDNDLAKAYAPVTSMKQLEDDPYRTLSRWVREACGYIKEGKEQCVNIGPGKISDFMEFRWANYLRSEVSLDDDPSTKQLRKAYEPSLEAVEKKHKPKNYFQQTWGLDAVAYGFNDTKKALNLKISKSGCDKDPDPNDIIDVK